MRHHRQCQSLIFQRNKHTDNNNRKNFANKTNAQTKDFDSAVFIGKTTFAKFTIKMLKISKTFDKYYKQITKTFQTGDILLVNILFFSIFITSTQKSLNSSLVIYSISCVWYIYNNTLAQHRCMKNLSEKINIFPIEILTTCINEGDFKVLYR